SQVLDAITKVPREQFVDPSYIPFAYEDSALPISAHQTISQPYVVARMTEVLLEHHPLKHILEIGTGSGYQAAVLSHVAEEIYTIERINDLYLNAKEKLKSYTNIFLKYGDGFLGWVEHAPYDAIIVTAAAEKVPDALLSQLTDGGCLVMPVGESHLQYLQFIEKHGKEYSSKILDPVIFVPLLHGKE
ncbi:MAG: protein-L-isoaspartate(D-aspartate) O-methyltransferase, partial [Proteobacteria bacterium]|nr:protein-L-isoaspartate(D-aspartate) O-methyltransferase [Pseudomonadota bacterium]